MKNAKLSLLVLAILTFLSALSGCGCKHEYSSEVTTPATCVSEGEMTYTCKLCGKTYTESIEKNDNHEYTSVITKEATSTETGVMTYTCSRCGETRTETIPKVVSNWVIDYYVDDFGDKTDSAYVRGEFWGSFSNSATTGSDLLIYIYFDESDITTIKLAEYGSHLATFNTDYDTVTLKTKDSNDKTASYDLIDFAKSGSLYCLDKSLKDDILQNKELSIVITETYKGGNTGSKYSFKIDNVGLAEMLKTIK